MAAMNTSAQSAGLVQEVRTAAATLSWDSKSVKFFIGISPIIGKTREGAQEKYDCAKKNSDIICGLAQFSGTRELA